MFNNKRENKREIQKRDIFHNRMLIDSTNVTDHHVLYDLLHLHDDRPIVILSFDKKTPFYLSRDSFLKQVRKILPKKEVIYRDANEILRENECFNSSYSSSNEYYSFESVFLKSILGDGYKSEVLFVEVSDLDSEKLNQFFELFLTVMEENLVNIIGSKRTFFAISGLIKLLLNNDDIETENISRFMMMTAQTRALGVPVVFMEGEIISVERLNKKEVGQKIIGNIAFHKGASDLVFNQNDRTLCFKK